MPRRPLHGCEVTASAMLDLMSKLVDRLERLEAQDSDPGDQTADRYQVGTDLGPDRPVEVYGCID